MLTTQLMNSEHWSELAHKSPDFEYRSVVQYAELLAVHHNARVEFVAIMRDSTPIALVAIRLRHWSKIGPGVAYVAGAILRVDPTSSELPAISLASLLEAVKAEYSSRRGMLLRFAASPTVPGLSEAREAAFLESGFVLATSGRKYRTILINLSVSESELRSRLHSKWRSHLVKAEKSGIVIEISADQSALERFLPLFDQMHQRKGFDQSLHPSLHAQVQATCMSSDRFVVIFARRDGVDVGAIALSTLGAMATYIYGATNEAGLAARAGYLLQWRGLLCAKERGCEWYDLCGIDPEGNPGGFQFKSGMGGEQIQAPGPFDFIPSGLNGLAWRSLLRIQEWRKRFIQRA